MQHSIITDSDGWFDEEDDKLIEELVQALRINRQNEKKRNDDNSQPQQASSWMTFRHQSKNACVCTKMSPSGTQKCVRFADNPRVIPRRKRHHMLEDPSVCWYTPEEMNSIFRGIRRLLKKLKRMELDATTLGKLQDCLRGLEDVFPLLLLIEQDYNNKTRTSCPSRRRRTKQNKFVRTILDWQADQKTSEDSFSLAKGDDPVGLRMVSVSSSKQSRDLARARAVQDYLEVQKLWQIDAHKEKLDFNAHPSEIKTDPKPEIVSFTIQPIVTKQSSDHDSAFPIKASSKLEFTNNYSSLQDHLRSSLLLSCTQEYSSFF